MANAAQILNKIARDAVALNLTVNSNDGTSLVIDDGSNDVLVVYSPASIQSPMGGIDDTTGTFLGVGTQNPGVLLFSKNEAGNQTIAQVFDTIETAQVFGLCMAFGNTIYIMDGNEGLGTAAVLVEIDANATIKNVGQ